MASSKNGRAPFRKIHLSYAQKPKSADEVQYDRAADGRIACWQRNIAPLRIWLSWDGVPGFATTWRIGDSDWSKYGVNSLAEILYITVGTVEKFIVQANSEVRIFMTSQEVADFAGHVRREESLPRMLKKVWFERWLESGAETKW